MLFEVFFACAALGLSGLPLAGWVSLGWNFWPFLAVVVVSGLLLVFWPFLAVLVVYWRCPCAGRHLLSLPPQRKISKESGSHR